jgi:hypothetical protein
MKLRLALLLAGALVVCGPAFATTIQFTQAYPNGYTLPPGSPTTTTAWTVLLNQLPLFDPSWGYLSSVTLEVGASVDGIARVENLDNLPADITLLLTAAITANGPGSVSVVANPFVSQLFHAQAFDLAIDFGGTSGTIYGPVNASATSSSMWTDQAILDAFTGVGYFTETFTAVSHSKAEGTGNLITWFTTNAGGYVTVTYDYNLTPEPGAFFLAGPALLLAGMLRRKLRA